MIFSDTASAPTSAGTSQCHRRCSHRNVASTIAAPAASAVPSGWIVLDACSTVGAVNTRTITVARASNGILKSPIRNHMHTVKIASQSAPTRRAVVTRLSDTRHLLEDPADGALDRVVRGWVDVGGVVARFLEVGGRNCFELHRGSSASSGASIPRHASSRMASWPNLSPAGTRWPLWTLYM